MVGMRATSHDLVLNDVHLPEENFVEIRGAGVKNGWILHIQVLLGYCSSST